MKEQASRSRCAMRHVGCWPKRSVAMIEGLAIEAIAGAQQSAAIQGPGSGGPQTIDLPTEALQQPSGAHAVDFARAIAGAPSQEVQAAPPASADGWVDRIAHQADALASHLKMPPTDGQSPEAASAAAADAPHAAGFDKDTMAAAVSQMERAYMFAIETTMASRGSTESTKIFNTLLKGQ